MICSEDGKTARWDAGGQWITDSQTNITRIVKELGLESYRQHDKGKKVLETDGKIVSYDSPIPKISIIGLINLQVLLTKINSSCKKLSTIDVKLSKSDVEKLDKTNMEKFLASKLVTKSSRSIIDPAIRTIFGAELSQLNTLYGLTYIKSAGSFEKLALTETDCAQEKKVKGGTQQISDKLLRAVNLYDSMLLNTAMIEVDQDDMVQVKCKNTVTNETSVIKAKKVISAIPINQYVSVDFKPELPWKKRHVYQFSQMGNLVKFIVTYKRSFWRDFGFSGEVVSDGSVLWIDQDSGQSPTLGPISCVFDGTDSDNNPALVGFIGGKPSVEWMNMADETRKIEIIHGLIRYFGEEAGNYLDYYEKVWCREKYSGGCPVCNISSSGLMEDYFNAVREPFMNVHFCGTETATVWQGYMDGAVESGERAANEVLYQLYKSDEEKLKSIPFEKTYYGHKSMLKSKK